MNKVKNKAKLIIGLLIAAINILWTAHWIWFFYAYHFTSILWLFMYPDWILILNISIGLIGVYVGYSLIKSKMSVLTALITDIPILIMGLIVSIYVPL
jgi:hypothetical protein